VTLIVNGTTIPPTTGVVNANGSAMDKVYANGTKVWHRQTSFTHYEINTTATSYATTAENITIGIQGGSVVINDNDIDRAFRLYLKDNGT